VGVARAGFANIPNAAAIIVNTIVVRLIIRSPLALHQACSEAFERRDADLNTTPEGFHPPPGRDIKFPR
jgi:hypothetical protein